MSATKSSARAQTVQPVTDELTILGYAVGWVLILLGLFVLSLTLTN